MKNFVLILSILCLNSIACKSSDPLPEAPKRDIKNANIVKIEMPVPAGRHVACTDLIPDLAPYSKGIGEDIGVLNDMTKTNTKATAMCALHKAGKAPKQNMNPQTELEKTAIHGVLAGDEYCTVSTYCSIFMEDEDFTKKCEKDGNRLSELNGNRACVRETIRGPKYAYTYKIIEPDTKCLLEVMGGPSVTDENIVQGCARAAVDSINKGSIANHK